MEQSKKDCILSCAAKIFSRFGLKKTSVGEIAESAGVAKGTIYLACQSKEDLFYQVLHRELRDWLADGAKVIDPRVAADSQLVPLVVQSLTQLESRPLVRDLLAGKLHATMPGWEKQLDELYELARSNLSELLTLGARQHRFSSHVSVDDAARGIQDFMIAAVAHAQRQASSRLPDDVLKRVETSVRMLLAGIRVEA